MKWHALIKPFCIVVFCVVVLLGQRPIRLFLGEIGFPVESAHAFIQRHGVRRIVAAWKGFRHGPHRDYLESEIERMRITLNELDAIAIENKQLRKALELDLRQHGSTVCAEILSHGGGLGVWPVLRIDKGARDGIAIGNAVVAKEGLVGIVDGVGFNHADVMLISDPRCKVSVQIKTGLPNRPVQGILAGRGGRQLDRDTFGLLYYEDPYAISYLSIDAQLTPHMDVETTGEGRRFPKGLHVGIIQSVNRTDNNLYRTAEVEPAINALNLSFVFVLTGTPIDATD